jgi:hypothetical protein
MADRENGRLLPPDVHPAYLEIVRNPDTRSEGLSQALETLVVSNAVNESPGEFAANLFSATKIFEKSQYQCFVQGDLEACVMMYDIEHDLGRTVQMADQRRIQAAQETILFSLHNKIAPNKS